MELIPIIKASLGIFTVLTSFTFMVSFAVYKVKSRNRLKPYERETEEIISNLILEVHESPEEKEKKEKNKKFKVLNENADDDQVKKIIKKNEDHSGLKKIQKPKVAESFNHISKPSNSKKSENEVFNIYSFYSNSDLRPMHKLKINAALVE